MHTKLAGKYIKNRKYMIHSFIKGLSVIASLMLFQACDSSEEPVDTKSNLSLDMRSVPNDIADNSLLYVFDAASTYRYRQLNFNRDAGTDVWKTDMAVGQWNLVMLSCNTSLEGKIILPTPGQPMSSSPLWKTGLEPGGNYLADMPELRYAPVISTPIPTLIQANLTTTATATLNRAVAKIRILLEEYEGFDDGVIHGHTEAYVELEDVPTTLLWNGKVLFSDISAKPMRKYFSFDPVTHKADTIEFIIPADIDAATFDPATAHQMRVKVSMPIGGQSFLGKSPFKIPFVSVPAQPGDIPYVPKPNGIIEIKLKFRGEPNTKLDVKVTVKEWEGSIDEEKTFN